MIYKLSGLVRFSYVLDPSAPTGRQQRTTLDLEVRAPTRVRVGPVQSLSRGPEDQFVPFLVLSEHGNETTNFHGDGVQQQGEEKCNGEWL